LNSKLIVPVDQVLEEGLYVIVLELGHVEELESLSKVVDEQAVLTPQC
jgi:hypothetical protein